MVENCLNRAGSPAEFGLIEMIPLILLNIDGVNYFC